MERTAFVKQLPTEYEWARMEDMGISYDEFQTFNLAFYDTINERSDTMRNFIAMVCCNKRIISLMDLESGAAFPAYKVFFDSCGKIVIASDR